MKAQPVARLLPTQDNTHIITHTDIHASSGIRTQNPAFEQGKLAYNYTPWSYFSEIRKHDI
jgi:hypothetical protein